MISGSVTRNGDRSAAAWWPERLAAVLAVLGVLAAVLQGYHVRAWQDSGSDFKTLYASAWCFLHGRGAYDFHDIGSAFDAGHVVRPFSWYAHSPIYPPFTFVALAPLITLPMAAAVCVWLALSAAGTVWAMWTMADASERWFRLGRAWRMGIIAMIAASPLLSFGLEVGNVSVLVGALCIVAVMCDTGGVWWRASALAVCLLLKPHIVLWVLVGMLLSRNRADRGVAVRAVGLAAAVALLFAVWGSLTLPFGIQTRQFEAMVRDEMARGSLDPKNRELLPATAQITSFESLVGYFLPAPWMQVVTVAVLASLAGLLVILSRAWSLNRADTRLELLGAWGAFGLLPTYHRAHDGFVLSLLIPWLLMRLARRWSDGMAWGVFGLGVAMALSDSPPHYLWMGKVGLPGLAEFLVFRQTACATVLLLVILLGHLVRQQRARQAKLTETSRAPFVPAIESADSAIALG